MKGIKINREGQEEEKRGRDHTVAKTTITIAKTLRVGNKFYRMPTMCQAPK